jgi:hypothetical protein
MRVVRSIWPGEELVDPERPNLFKFAKSERHQDAFLCWLLSWAHRRQRRRDKALHTTAVHLLHKLLALHKVAAPEKCRSLEIKPQYKNRIDILVLVNRDIALLIEDKKRPTISGDQLREYLSIVRTDQDLRGRTVLPVYFQTGNQSSYRDVEKAGYKVFNRYNLLDVLRNGKEKIGVQNDIYDDFLNQLEKFNRQ